MIDLETLGTQPGSIILSIGAVIFDPTLPPDNCITDEFSCVIDLQSCIEANLTASASTIKWWSTQSLEARKVLIKASDAESKTNLTLTNALIALANFMPSDAIVWSNGANFDQPLLDVAYNHVDKQVPWKYYNSRCYRTFTALCEQKKALAPPVILAHDALEDAKWQTHHMMIIAKHMGLTIR